MGGFQKFVGSVLTTSKRVESLQGLGECVMITPNRGGSSQIFGAGVVLTTSKRVGGLKRFVGCVLPTASV